MIGDTATVDRAALGSAAAAVVSAFEATEANMPDIAAHLAPMAAALDRDPSRLGAHYDVLRRHGYLRTAVPRELGGAGAGLSEVVVMQRTLAASCSNTALAVNMHLFQVGTLAGAWSTNPLAAALLRDVADHGSVLASTTGEALTLDPFTTPTSLAPTSSGYRLSGRKRFCSQAGVMDLVRVLATDATTGRLVMLMVPADAPGVRVVETRPLMGMRGTQSFDIGFDDVELGEDAVLARFAGAAPLGDVGFASGAVWFLMTIAAVYAGVADGAVAALEAVDDRRADGRVRLLQHRLDALIAHGTGRLDGRVDRPDALRTAVSTKVEVIATAQSLVDACVDRAGSVAYVSGTPLERAVRDVRAGRHHPPDAATTARLLTSQPRRA